MTRYKIVIDRGVCQGHSVCVYEAPDLFAVEDVGGAYPLARPRKEFVTGANLDAARQAASYCPNQAIKIVPAPEDDAG